MTHSALYIVILQNLCNTTKKGVNNLYYYRDQVLPGRPPIYNGSLVLVAEKLAQVSQEDVNDCVSILYTDIDPLCPLLQTCKKCHSPSHNCSLAEYSKTSRLGPLSNTSTIYIEQQHNSIIRFLSNVFFNYLAISHLHQKVIRVNRTGNIKQKSRTISSQEVDRETKMNSNIEAVN